MIVAIAYHDGDVELMKRWAKRVKQLGPYMNHEIVIAPIRGVTTEDIEMPLSNCFRKVHVLPCTHSERGWPVSCNRAFQAIAWHAILNTRQPFLFMEPDAIPLCEGWIDKIEAEYRQCQRPFMGDFVELSKSEIPGGIDHMSGIAVYDCNLSITAPRLFNCSNGVDEYAWDVWAASDIVPKMHKTKLIQHDWRGTGDKPHQWRKNNVDPSFVNDGAVVYHPDKRGVLLNDGLAGEGTRAEGEPSTGAPVSDSSFEHPSPALTKGTEESEEQALQNALNVVSFYHKLDAKFKRKVTKGLIERGLIAKTKSSKQSRKKVRRSVGVDQGAGISN